MSLIKLCWVVWYSEINMYDENLMEKKEYYNRINETIIELQANDKEWIEDVMAVKAYYIIKNIFIENVHDVFLFCSALNLLNTYVKQDKKIGYQFKLELNYLLAVLKNNKIEGISIDYQNNNGNLLVIDILGVQFSFHNPKITNELKRIIGSDYKKDITWDGIRKQQCARTVFELAISCPNRTNSTFRGKDLDKCVERLIENYQNNKISFAKIVEK